MPTPSAGAGATTGAKRPRMDINNIANKMKRSEVLAKFKADNKKAKKERRKTRDMLAAELGDAAPPKQVRLATQQLITAARVGKLFCM